MDLKRIKAEIKRQGFKQNSLAERIGVHPNTLSRFLTGRTMLGSEALLELLKILGLSAEALLRKAS